MQQSPPNVSATVHSSQQRIVDSLDREVEASPSRLSDVEVAIAALSHDLRAPLRAVDGYISLLSAELPLEVSPAARNYIDRARRSVRRAQGMIDQLLELFRCGQAPLVRQDVDLSAVANGIVEELIAAEPHRLVAVHIEQNMHVTADPELMRRMLYNLLGNAWKFTAESARPEIRFYRDEGIAPARFCVEDNGCGFDMAEANELFQPFRRMASSRYYEGYGLGLAIVRQILDLHQGSIYAKSIPAVGARFLFTLEP